MLPDSLTTVCVVSSLLTIEGAKWPTLEVGFSFIFGGYNPVPLNTSAIEGKEEREYYKVEHDDELNVDVYSQKYEPRLSLLYDTYGNIAGVRTGYIKKDVVRKAEKGFLSFPYNFSSIPMFKSGEMWHTPVWYASVLFVHPDKLKTGGRNETQGEVAESIYVILDGRWTEVEYKEADVIKQGFIKQACFFGIGQHYFYNFDKHSDCREYQPFFAVYHNSELHGFGLAPFGSFTHKPGGQKWFEEVTLNDFKSAIPHGPLCAAFWFQYIGISPLHFFLRPNAKWTMCPFFSHTAK